MSDIWGRMGVAGSWLGGIINAIFERYVLVRLPVLLPSSPTPQYPAGDHPLHGLVTDLNRNVSELTAELRASRNAEEARSREIIRLLGLSVDPTGGGASSP